MQLELWRWKPRLVWLVMHAATLGLLWCARAWPTQPHFGALLVTTAALYASVSFVDPGYVELASTSVAMPDRAALSALTVPLVLQACTPCTCDAAADAMAAEMPTPCAHATHMPRTCHAHCQAHAYAHARAHAVLQACEMCMVDKPPRAKHCYDCGRSLALALTLTLTLA